MSAGDVTISIHIAKDAGRVMTPAKTPKEKILSALYDNMRQAKTPEEQEMWMTVVESVTDILDKELG